MKDVRDAQPTSTDRVLWDSAVGQGGLVGFGVRIKPSGAKSWLVQYRTESGITRRMSLGRIDHLSLAQARREAQRKLAEARTGKDPAAQRTEHRRSETLKKVAEEWISADIVIGGQGDPLKASTVAEYKRLLESDVYPALGSTKLRALTQRQIKAFYLRLSDSGKAVTANRALALVSSFLGWCVERDLIDANPARGIRRAKKGVEKADTRALSQAETGRFLRACETLRAQAKPATEDEPARGQYPARMAVCFELMLLCGLRPAEAMELRWDQIDFDAGLIRFNADEQKGGHARPAYLKGPAVALLKVLDKTDNEWVFPSRRVRGQPVDDPRKVWDKVEKLAAFDAPAKPKHLRKTHLTLGRAMGIPLDVLSKSARHMDESVTARHYIHTGDDSVHAAEDELQARLAALANEPAKVLRFGSAERESR